MTAQIQPLHSSYQQLQHNREPLNTIYAAQDRKKACLTITAPRVPKCRSVVYLAIPVGQWQRNIIQYKRIIWYHAANGHNRACGTQEQYSATLLATCCINRATHQTHPCPLLTTTVATAKVILLVFCLKARRATNIAWGFDIYLWPCGELHFGVATFPTLRRLRPHRALSPAWHPHW